MLWGKSIFPHFHVYAPMPYVVRPPAPKQIPADIAYAIDVLDVCVENCTHATATVGPRPVLAKAVEAARADLEALILKHLRGEA